MSDLTPLLVTAATIKEYGVLEDNVDVKLINTTTIMVQDIQLQQILGTDLYKEICNQVNAESVSALNTTLLNDYIRNFLMNAVIADGVLSFNYRFANKAIITANSDNQNPVGKEEIEMIRAKWQGQADFYAKRLTKYLVQESNSYPLYMANSDISDMHAKSAKYNSGIYLGNTRRGNQKTRLNYPYCLDNENGNC